MRYTHGRAYAFEVRVMRALLFEMDGREFDAQKQIVVQN